MNLSLGLVVLLFAETRTITPQCHSLPIPSCTNGLRAGAGTRRAGGGGGDSVIEWVSNGSSCFSGFCYGFLLSRQKL